MEFALRVSDINKKHSVKNQPTLSKKMDSLVGQQILLLSDSTRKSYKKYLRSLCLTKPVFTVMLNNTKIFMKNFIY